MERVVVTGAGALSPIGSDWSEVSQALRKCRNAVVEMSDWAAISGLRCRLAAPIVGLDPPPYSRRQRRSMGRVAELAVRASEIAIYHAGLTDDPVLCSGRAGVAFGSGTGSPSALLEFVSTLTDNSTAGLSTTSYLRMMPHTTAVNVSLYFGITGRVLTTSSACTAASQGIGYAYEQIRGGLQDVMIAGGAEELTPAHVGLFDALFAASVRNDTPSATPRPFDIERDGLVVGEGAGALVLENLRHAHARGANILCELVGFATNADGAHVTQPKSRTQTRCMSLALEDAGLDARAIDFVSAHGTGTVQGDLVEADSTFAALGAKPISSLKSYVGHTLGACGALEAIWSIMMMNEGWFAPTVNLTRPDPACAEHDYLMGEPRRLQAEHIMSNNFAFGGINTSLIFRRWA